MELKSVHESVHLKSQGIALFHWQNKNDYRSEWRSIWWQLSLRNGVSQVHGILEIAPKHQLQCPISWILPKTTSCNCVWWNIESVLLEWDCWWTWWESRPSFGVSEFVGLKHKAMTSFPVGLNPSGALLSKTALVPRHCVRNKMTDMNNYSMDKHLVLHSQTG